MNTATVAPNEMFGEACPASAPFFGYMGAAAALIFANLGAAYGTAKSGVGICSMGVMHPQLIMKSIIPIPQYTLFSAFGHLGSCLTGGLSGLAAGMAIGIVGDAGVRATAQQPKLFVGMILILIFAEALGLYGLIVALIMSSSGGGNCPAVAA